MYKKIIKPTLVLCAICAVVSLVIAFTYQAAGIANLGTGLSSAQLEEYKPLVLPSATKLVKVDITTENPNFLEAYKDEGGAGSAFFFVTNGYGGANTLKMMVGIDVNGAVAGATVIENAETPGLGSKALTPEFLANFTGITAPVTVDKAGNGADVDAVSSATISSKAVGDAFSLALEIYNQVKGDL